MFLFLCYFFLAAGAQARDLNYAPLPMENPRHTVALNQPLLAEVIRSSGLSLRVRHYADYADILAAFAAGDIDVAYLGPLPFLALHSLTSAAEPLVIFRESDGFPVYTCALVTPFDGVADSSALQSAAVTSTEPLSVAITQPLSTCGTLVTTWMLQQQGVRTDQFNARTLGHHEAVALAVVRGEFAVGGVKTDIAHRFSPLGLRVLRQSPRLPGFAWVINRATVPDATITVLRDALLGIPDERLAELDLGRHGFALPDREAYQRLETMLAETGLSLTELLNRSGSPCTNYN